MMPLKNTEKKSDRFAICLDTCLDELANKIAMEEPISRAHIKRQLLLCLELGQVAHRHPALFHLPESLK